MRRVLVLVLVGLGLLVGMSVVAAMVMVGLTVWATGDAIERARVDLAEMEVRRFEERVEIWRLRHRDAPGSLDDVSESPGASDPWGRPYRLQPDGDALFVVSDGPDRTPGTADDVRSAGVR